jgi:hypothetical protein
MVRSAVLGACLTCTSSSLASPHLDDEPYRHPLLTAEGEAALDSVRTAHPEYSDLDVLRALSLVASVRQADEQAEAVPWAGAIEVQVETEPGHPAPVEVSREAVLLSDRLAELVAPPYSLAGEVFELRLIVQPERLVRSPPLYREISLAVLRGELATWGDSDRELAE